MPLKSFDFKYPNENSAVLNLQDIFVEFQSILSNGSVIDAFIDYPPDDFEARELYITSDSPKGEWSGYPKHVACYIFDRWVFSEPQDGASLFFKSEESFFWYDGSSGEWKKISGSGDGGATIYNSETEPADPSKNEIWRDTSLNPSWLKIYNGFTWELCGSGDSVHYRDYRNIDFEDGDLSGNTEVENNKLKLQTI